MFQGRQGVFPHELGALYVACLLLGPPREPLQAVALALQAKKRLGGLAGPDELLQQRGLGLEAPATIRALWQRQSELERVLQDRREPEPVKAEALRELEQITDYLRQTPWMSRHGAERCACAVGVAIRHLYAHLARAVRADGKPDEVLRAFAEHLREHLLLPSGRGARNGRTHAWTPPGWFIYVPPQRVAWEVQCLKSKVQSRKPEGEVKSPANVECGVRDADCQRNCDCALRGSKCGGRRSQHKATLRSAAADYLSRFLSAGLVLAVLATGCAGPRPLKGGKAVLTRKPAGIVEQTLVQSENPAQATKQDEQTVKVRTYTVPAGSRVEPSPMPDTAAANTASPASANRQPSTIHSQPSTTFILSAPMPVVEREETRGRTELGAAQKDTARELGAKLASLKGIVWVGVGLFVFGLASLVWPPLKAVIASVTTSAALMLGGVALMVLPSLVVGNELLILGVVALTVGGWFLAHRHGHLRGLVAASQPAAGVVSGQPSVASSQHPVTSGQ